MTETTEQKKPAPTGKPSYQQRLDNQKAQLDRHGNFAEVVIRTTPEATDMMNFARLWEYVLIQADRQSRGYVAKSSRNEYDATHQDFEDSIAFMVQKLQGCIARHDIDLSGKNFISRVAQRYQVANAAGADGSTATPAAATAPPEVDEVEAI